MMNKKRPTRPCRVRTVALTACSELSTPCAWSIAAKFAHVKLDCLHFRLRLEAEAGPYNCFLAKQNICTILAVTRAINAKPTEEEEHANYFSHNSQPSPNQLGYEGHHLCRCTGVRYCRH